KLQEDKGESELRNSILTALAIPDEVLTKLMMDLSATEATLAKLKPTLGAKHPDFIAWAAMQADLDEKVNRRIQCILEGLQVKVDAVKAHADSLAKSVDDARKKDTDTTEQNRPYFEAKRKLENL